MSGGRCELGITLLNGREVDHVWSFTERTLLSYCCVVVVVVVELLVGVDRRRHLELVCGVRVGGVIVDCEPLSAAGVPAFDVVDRLRQWSTQRLGQQ